MFNYGGRGAKSYVHFHIIVGKIFSLQDRSHHDYKFLPQLVPSQVNDLNTPDETKNNYMRLMKFSLFLNIVIQKECAHSKVFLSLN